MSEIVQKALDIAIKDLRSCYQEEGIVAGLKHFDDYWARDSFFASLGSIAIGDFEIARKNFLLFLKFQKADGQLARRLDRHYVLLKYLGIKIIRPRFKIKYHTAFGTKPVADSNSLFIIALRFYLEKSGDLELVKENYVQIKKIMDWNFKLDKDDDGLLEEGYLANWEDTIFKQGKVIYTNVLHYMALKSFTEVAKLVGENFDFYEKSAERVRGQLEKYFWHGEFYIGWIGRLIHKVFIADGNLLAIISGLAGLSRAGLILDKINQYNKRENLIKNIDFKYGLWRHSPVRTIGRARGYHEKFEWLWLNCLLALAKNKIGDKDGAKFELEKMAEIIVRYNHVYEVYKENAPVKSRFFVSEVPFAWSAGLFVYVANLINKGG
jgi:glycogen debranching enzyme